MSTRKKPEYVLLDLDMDCHVNPDGSLWHEWQRDESFLPGWEMNFSFYASRDIALRYAQIHRAKWPAFRRFQVLTVNEYISSLGNRQLHNPQ